MPLGEESVAWVLPPFLPSGGLSWLRGGVGCHVPAFRVWGPFPGRRSNRHPPRAVWTSVSLSVVASSLLSVCSSHARPLAGPGVSINILKWLFGLRVVGPWFLGVWVCDLVRVCGFHALFRNVI